MSLPGLAGITEPTSKRTQIELEALNEWRFEVNFNARLVVRLLTGTAELFGTELVVGEEYEFSGQKSAIFTWEGCKIEYEGEVNEYSSDNTPMPVYANLHFALQDLCEQKQSPRLLVLGSPNSGKSTLCKILVSYARKRGSYPLLVNLDPENPVFTPPGGLSASVIADVLDVQQGWGSTPIDKPSEIAGKQSIVYYYGLSSPTANTLYYKHTCSRLALAVSARLEDDEVIKDSGMIIDSTNVLSDVSNNFSILSSIITDFDITALAIVGNERLYSDLTKRLANRQIKILKVPKSSGCVDSDATFIRQVQKASIQQYFYGSLDYALSPMTITARFNEVTVFRVLEAAKPVDSALADGDANENETPKLPGEDYLVKVEPSSVLQNCLLAVANASITDSLDTIADSEILGFVHVVEADDKKRSLRVLLPHTGRIPQKPLIMSEFRYHE